MLQQDEEVDPELAAAIALSLQPDSGSHPEDARANTDHSKRKFQHE
jgi:hypothetical protein